MIFICSPMFIFINLALFNLIIQLELWLYCHYTHTVICIHVFHNEEYLNFIYFSWIIMKNISVNVPKLYLQWELIIFGNTEWEFPTFSYTAGILCKSVFGGGVEFKTFWTLYSKTSDFFDFNGVWTGHWMNK